MIEIKIKPITKKSTGVITVDGTDYLYTDDVDLSKAIKAIINLSRYPKESISLLRMITDDSYVIVQDWLV